jgi:uncharacterized protein YggE
VLLALLVACGVSLATSGLSLAVDGVPDPYCTGRRIATSGEGTVKLDPNEATIEFGVVTIAPTGAEAGRRNATIADAVFKALDRFTLKSKSTAGYSMQPNFTYEEGKPPRLVNFTVSNMVRIRTGTLKDVGALIDAALAAGANAVNTLQFTSTDLESARYRALGKAIVDARYRAEAMAKAAELKLGQVVWLSDGTGDTAPPILRAMPMAFEAKSTTPIEAGQLEVSASVQFVACLISP